MLADTKILVENVLAGDRVAFNTLIELHQRLVLHVVYRMVSNRSDVEDICQDVFIKVYQHLPAFKFGSKLSTWIAKIAFNTTLNFLEKKKAVLFDDFSPDDIGLDSISCDQSRPDENIVDGEVASILQDEIDRLPVHYRTIITLYHLHEMRYKEIGEIMELPEGTVKSYLFRARRLLKNKLTLKYQTEELYQ